MLEEERPHAGLGHNNPPAPVDEIVEEVRRFTFEKRARLEQCITAAERKQVSDRTTAGDAGDIIAAGRALIDNVDEFRLKRVRVIRSSLDKAKGVQDGFLEPLQIAIHDLQRRLDRWTVENDKRIAAQAAEQDAFFGEAVSDMCLEPPAPAAPQPREAVDYSAPVSPSPAPARPAEVRKTRIVGDLGTKVTSSEEKTFTVTDVKAVPLFVLESPSVLAAIAAVAKSMHKHVPNIAGITVTTNTKAKVK